MSVISRILKIIEYKGISKSRFYKETSLSNGFLDKVKDVGVSKIEKILSSYHDINPEWLLTGNGDMLKSKNNDVNQNVTGSNVTMAGGSVNIKNSNNTNGINNKALKDDLKTYKTLLKEKDEEIKRLKAQVDKLFKMIG